MLFTDRTYKICLKEYLVNAHKIIVGKDLRLWNVISPLHPAFSIPPETVLLLLFVSKNSSILVIVSVFIAVHWKPMKYCSLVLESLIYSLFLLHFLFHSAARPIILIHV